jgi:CysZ protein
MLKLAPLKPMEGVSCLIAGWRVGLSDPTVRGQLLKSLAVNAVVFLVLFIALVWAIFALTSDLVSGTSDLPGWLSWLDFLGSALGWLVRLALLSLAAMIAPTLLSLLLGIIMPMFMGPVFHAGRAYAKGPPVAETGGLSAEAVSIAIDLRRLGRLILFSILIIPLNIIPGLGQLAYFVAQALLAAHTLGWDLLGYHFELHGVGYAEQRNIIARNRGLVLAVGAVGVVLLMIPFVNVFFATTNIVGAGILSARLDGAPMPANPR